MFYLLAYLWRRTKFISMAYHDGIFDENEKTKQ